MSKSLFKLSQAMSGRRAAAPRTREGILRSLLGMRAAAARAGLIQMEKQLRNQIRWCLPIQRPHDPVAEQAHQDAGDESLGVPEVSRADAQLSNPFS